MLSSNLGYYLTWSEWTNKNTLFFIYTKRPIHCDQFSLDVYNMVLILDGNSEMGAHVRSNLCYLISFRHLIRLREYVFIRKGFFFVHTCTVCSEFPSNFSTMVSFENWKQYFPELANKFFFK